jgi:hypothetical protein
MSKPISTRAGRPPRDEVDMAVDALRRSIGRMITLLGHEDLDIAQRAYRPLVELGASTVVGPLSSALPRARSPRHRGFIVMLLLEFAAVEKARVLRALTLALHREQEPLLKASIQFALTHTILTDIVDLAGTPGREATYQA